MKLIDSRETGEKPTNSSRGVGRIFETPYKPGFVDDMDLETVKMAVDKELSDVSNAFQITTERTADTITQIEELKITNDNQYGELSASIKEVNKVSLAGDEALAKRITTFEAVVNNQFGEVNAAIKEETTARASADEALAQRITEYKAELDTEIGKNTALITSETTARVTADEALATRVDNILGAMQGDLGPLVGQIQTDLRVLATQDTVLAEKIDNVTASFQQADKDLDASIKTETQARIDADSALAQQITTLRADVATEDLRLGSEITNTNKVIADLDKTVASNKLELESAISSSGGSASAALEQARKDLEKAIADGDLAEAARLKEEIDKLLKIIGDNKADIESKLAITNTTITDLTKTVAENKTELQSSITTAQNNAVNEATSNAQNALNAAERLLQKAIEDGDIAEAERLKAEIARLTGVIDANKSDIEKALTSAQTALEKAIADGDTAEAERLKAEIERLLGIINGNKADIEAKLSVTNTTVADLDKAVASQKTELQADYNGKIGTVTNNLTVVSNKLGQVESQWGLNVSAGAVTGSIQLGASSGGTSNFTVRADKMEFTDGANVSRPITFEGGRAAFNDIIVRGVVYGDGGHFRHVTIYEDCTILGTIHASQLRGDAVAFKSLAATVPAGAHSYSRHFTVLPASYDRDVVVSGVVIKSGSSYPSDDLAQTIAGLNVNGVNVNVTQSSSSQRGVGEFFGASHRLPANTQGNYQLYINTYAVDLDGLVELGGASVAVARVQTETFA